MRFIKGGRQSYSPFYYRKTEQKPHVVSMLTPKNLIFNFPAHIL